MSQPDDDMEIAGAGSVQLGSAHTLTLFPAARALFMFGVRLDRSRANY